jgi:hypothetical protein
MGLPPLATRRLVRCSAEHDDGSPSGLVEEPVACSGARSIGAAQATLLVREVIS